MGRGRRGARHAPPEHHRPVDRPSADPQRGPHRLDRVQRRDLQLPRAARASSKRAATGSTRRPTPRSSSTPTSSGARRDSAAARHVRPRDLGHAVADAAASRATASASSRCTTRRSTDASISAPSSSRCCARPTCRATSTSTRSITTCRSSTRRATARSSSSVRKLPPGHLLTWTGRRASAIEQYWQTAGGRRRSRAPRRTRSQQLRDVLTDAVRSHLVSDVPLGAFLSGGVDSSLVVGLMARDVRRAGEDVLDRLRRAGVRRARARAPRRRSLRHRASRVRRRSRTPSASSIGWCRTSTSRSPIRRRFRRGTCRRWRGGTSRSCCRATAATSCSAATTATCRIRAWSRSIATARAPLRRVAAIAAARLPHGARGKNFLRHVGRDDAGRYLDAIRFFGADEKPALLTRGRAARD